MVMPTMRIPSKEEIDKYVREHGLPNQGIADYLSRIDELLIANLMLNRQLLVNIQTTMPGTDRLQKYGTSLSLNEMKKALETGEFVPYEVKSYSMNSALTDEPITIEGDNLAAAVSSGGTLDGVTVRFNQQSADAVPLNFFNPWRQPFFQIFLTFTAQTGKTLYLAIGRSGASRPEMYLTTAEMKNFVSAVKDSTTTVLGDGATYTGDEFSTVEYGKIIGSCYANRAGTLYVDQRNDGTNWDIRDTFNYAAADTLGFEVDVLGNEARVVFTNDAGAAQTAFRLYARLRRM
jgi:hypothetical protein